MVQNELRKKHCTLKALIQMMAQSSHIKYNVNLRKQVKSENYQQLLDFLLRRNIELLLV